MNKDEIYKALTEEIPFLQRHECTPRIMEVTDSLLDKLIALSQGQTGEVQT